MHLAFTHGEERNAGSITVRLPERISRDSTAAFLPRIWVYRGQDLPNLDPHARSLAVQLRFDLCGIAKSLVPIGLIVWIVGFLQGQPPPVVGEKAGRSGNRKRPTSVRPRRVSTLRAIRCRRARSRASDRCACGTAISPGTRSSRSTTRRSCRRRRIIRSGSGTPPRARSCAATRARRKNARTSIIRRAGSTASFCRRTANASLPARGARPGCASTDFATRRSCSATRIRAPSESSRPRFLPTGNRWRPRPQLRPFASRRTPALRSSLATVSAMAESQVVRRLRPGTRTARHFAFTADDRIIWMFDPVYRQAHCRDDRAREQGHRDRLFSRTARRSPPAAPTSRSASGIRPARKGARGSGPT